MISALNALQQEAASEGQESEGTITTDTASSCNAATPKPLMKASSGKSREGIVDVDAERTSKTETRKVVKRIPLYDRVPEKTLLEDPTLAAKCSELREAAAKLIQEQTAAATQLWAARLIVNIRWQKPNKEVSYDERTNPPPPLKA